MRRAMLVLAVLALGGLVLAQGSSSSGNASGSSGNQPSSSGGLYVMLSSLRNSVDVNWALVDGEWRKVFTNDQGLTLYYNDQGTKAKAACTGSCTARWKPATLAKNLPEPTGQSNLTRFLSTASGPNGGKQILLDGHRLYTFSEDQVRGQALGSSASTSGHWHVATPELLRYG